ncbi:hypothetical protein V6Z11_A03G130200 [Gossypium hirsutum]
MVQNSSKICISYLGRIRFNVKYKRGQDRKRIRHSPPLFIGTSFHDFLSPALLYYSIPLKHITDFYGPKGINLLINSSV